MSNQRIVDFAVVGGGPGGTYSAWRLQKHLAGENSNLCVELFEYSDRIGGRLMSVHLPCMPKSLSLRPSKLPPFRITSTCGS